MLYPRNIYAQLEKEIETSQAIIITGMRRVGKSTALKHLFDHTSSSNKAIFDFENPAVRHIFDIKDYDSIWNLLAPYGIDKKSRAYIFIDEIQNLPMISSLAKYLHDHYQTKFFMTGSSSYYLKNLFPESMAGRKLIFEMFPLTFSEFLIFKADQIDIQIPPQHSQFKKISQLKNFVVYSKLISFYAEFMQFGGFPKVVLEPNHLKKTQILYETFKSYFEIDVKSLSDFKNLSLLYQLILLLIPRIGSKLDISKLSSELKISRETVGNYLTFLESTYLISRIPRFSQSIDREISGARKLYFCDVGLARSIGNISDGQAFEQSIFQNLRIDHDLKYYNTKSGDEIDFVVDKKIAFEVKKHAIQRDLANLHKRMKSANIKEGYLITQDFQELQGTIPVIDL
jgi:hypothetical protein